MLELTMSPPVLYPFWSTTLPVRKGLGDGTATVGARVRWSPCFAEVGWVGVRASIGPRG
jgi:hypothetical protein